jgi:hypothetical protein
MWKPILAGSTALVIAGSTLVYAQTRRDDSRRWQPSVEDLRAFGDARLAALKAGLALTPDQEKNWPAFEQAARDFQKLRLDRFNARVDARRSGRTRTTDPVERMQERATQMSETGAALKKLADATGPLYGSLDDSQKRRFGLLSRIGGDRAEGFRGREGFGERMHRWMHRDGGPRGFRRSEGDGRMEEHGMNMMPMPPQQPLGFNMRPQQMPFGMRAPINGEERL